jgi:DNA-binding LytR/AlgR family response regulator
MNALRDAHIEQRSSFCKGIKSEVLLERNMSELSRAKLAGAGLKDPLEELEERGDGHFHSAIQPVVAEGPAQITDFRPRSEPLGAKPVRIAIKTKGRILLVNPAEILAVEAEGNYVLLLRQSDTYLLRESISTMADKLRAYGFIRIHRSVLVNATWVEEIRPGATGEYVLRIASGKEFTVSRTYKHNLRGLAQSWIGTDSFVEE